MASKDFVPFYRQIFLELKNKIQEGAYAEGEKLPTEKQLCEQYKVERITIRHALELLADENLIVKRAGKGSFVADKSKEEDANSEEQRKHGSSGILLFVMRKSLNDLNSNANSYNAVLYFCMESLCKQYNYTLMYVGLPDDMALSDIIHQYRPAGIFLVTTVETHIVDEAKESGIPAMCLNHYDPRLMCVLPDNVKGVSLAVEHLWKNGHRQIALIAGLAHAVNGKERYDAFHAAMNAHGLICDPELEEYGNWTLMDAQKAMEDILARTDKDRRPTAVFAASDVMAIGAINAISKMGLSVPKDIAVVGFDDIDICSFITPNLTSIRTDVNQMSKVSVDQMLHIIQRGAREEDMFVIRIPAKLTPRDSSNIRKN